MNVGKRRPSALSAGRVVSLLVSAIALALVFFVVPAQAEECTSSSCVQYTPSLPKADGDSTPTHRQTPAKASKTGKGGGTASKSGADGPTEADGSGGDDSSQQGGVAPGNGDGGNGQGSPGGSAKEGGGGATQPGQNAVGTPATHSDGGSSPLVPILIAIAVLAAISVAVVLFRQRRQRGPTATASPEAN